MNDYQHPTREEWRAATQAIREMKAEKRGLEALARMKEMLARLPGPEVPCGTTSQNGAGK